MPKVAMLFVTTTGIPIGDALVEVRLTRTDFDDKTSGVLMNRLETFRTDANGEVTADLMACGALYHVTTYDTVQDIAIHWDFYVPASDDPNVVYRLQDLVVEPDTYMSSMPFDETAMLAILEARNAAREAAAQAKVSEKIASDSAAIAAGAIESVQANADRVELWAQDVDTKHTEVGQWRDQVSADRTVVVDATAVVVAAEQSAVAASTTAVQAASAASASEQSASQSAQTASTASGNAALAADATAADRAAVAANTASVKGWKDEVAANTLLVTNNTAAAQQHKELAYQYMQNAQNARDAAAVSETNAGKSATNADASATAATAASASATSAKLAAEVAQNKAEIRWTDFNTRYFGGYASNPATNSQGNAPVVGSLYWNTTTSTLRVWTGSSWYELINGFRTAQNRKIVVLGSSVALGQGSPTYTGWASRLGSALAARGYTLVNKSIAGNNVAACIERFYRDVVPETPGTVIIGLSIANEGLIGSSNKAQVYNTFVAGIRRLVAMCREMGYKVIVTGTYPNNDYTATDYMYALQANQEFENEDFQFINFMGTVDDGTGKWAPSTFTDGGHPSDAGHLFMYGAFDVSSFAAKVSDIVVRPDPARKFKMVAATTAAGAVPLQWQSQGELYSFSIMATIRRQPGATPGRPLIVLESSLGAYQPIRIRNSTDVIELAGTNNLMDTAAQTSSNAPINIILTFQANVNMWAIYIDGVLANTVVYGPQQTVWYDRIVFGGRNDAGGFETAGYEFSDLAVWRTVLNREQVREAYLGIIPKGSLTMYSPTIDAPNGKNSRLVNLAVSGTYVEVLADGLVGELDDSLYTAEQVRANTPVRTGPNGYLNPNLLDTQVPLRSQFPISAGPSMYNKFGYQFLQGGQGQRLYKIAEMPASSTGSYGSLRIEAFMGSWGSTTLTAMSVLMGSRDVFTVDWSASRGIPVDTRFVAYRDASGSVSVYLFFAAGSFGQAAFQIMSSGCPTYADPVPVSSAPGTLVWDSSATAAMTGYVAPRSVGLDAGAGPVANGGVGFNSAITVRPRDGSAGLSVLFPGQLTHATNAGIDYESLRLGIGASNGVSYAGSMTWFTSAGNGASPYTQGYTLSVRAFDSGSNNWSARLFSVTGAGVVTVPVKLNVGVINTEAQGTPKVEVFNSFTSYVVSGSFGNTAGAAMNVATHSGTGVSIRTGGTVNTGGNDYAEYFRKALHCATVMAGQVVGINDKNEISDLWADTVMFGIKSTSPSFVGGDDWAKHLGDRPVAKAGAEPQAPVRRPSEVVQEPDDAWEAKQEAFAVEHAEWTKLAEADKLASIEFDAKLEEARERVDRLAIAGRTPVNVYGAKPGDYIVPVQDGTGISAISVSEDAMTLKQYLRAVGQVISIEEDGRAYVMVKAV